MRIIKEKKLFGVLNLLDIAIISFILALVLPMLHYYIQLNERGLAEQKLISRFINQQMRDAVGFQAGQQAGDLDVYVSFKNLKRVDLEKIKPGDKDVLPDGTVLAEIMWTGEPQANYFIVDLGRDEKNIRKRTVDDGLFSLPVKLRLRGVIGDEGTFAFKTKVMRQLEFYIFNAGKYEVTFVVENINE